MSSSLGGRGCFPTGRHYPGIAHLLRVSEEGLAAEWDSTVPLAEIPWLAIDTETTGRDAARDRIVELGCVLFENGEVVSRNSWLIDPECSIPPETTAVHGIKDEDVRGKATFAQLADEIAAVLGQGLPLAYNAEFDRNFVAAEFARVEGRKGDVPALRSATAWLDPLSWARELHKEHKSRALGEVCERLGIALTNAHRATDDAEAAGRVLVSFLRDPRVPARYGAFMKEQRRLERLFEFERVRWR